MNLDKLIDQFIGEEAKKYKKQFQEEMTDECVIALNVLQNLKSRKQELVEGICKMLEEEVTNLSWEHENLSRHGDMPQDAYDRVLHFIDTLTGKFDA